MAMRIESFSSAVLVAAACVPGLIQAEPQMPRLVAATGPFKTPSKCIQDADDLKRFLAGNAVKDFVAFILSLNEAVTGRWAARLSCQLQCQCMPV